MQNQRNFYIDGRWVEPHGRQTADVVNPATEEVIGSVFLGDAQDVDDAVAAARRAFDAFSQTTPAERAALLERIIAVYERRMPEMAEVISAEVGAPLSLARVAQAPAGVDHFKTTLAALRQFEWESDMGRNRVVREAIGVCALITPWNWPMNQIGAKLAPALAAGCTVVLKPSEIAPLNAVLLAEILDEAGVPPGVFNLVHGDGPGVGTALARHPDVDMISFTGSTRAGVLVAQNAAPTVKRVAQELGGKSANIILDDANMEKAVAAGFRACARNTGQSCNAPTRMLVPHSRMEEVAAIAARAAQATRVGDPAAEDTELGPLVSRAQWEKVQQLIERGVAEGARLAAGGPGLPDGATRGYYARPTVFSHVTNDMTIAREEIFGPVLVIIGYDDEDDAVRIANDTPYGLAGFVSSADLERARRVGRRLRAGYVHLNGAPYRYEMPFGGYKQSGNGRENGAWGIGEFLETKAMLGYWPKS